MRTGLIFLAIFATLNLSLWLITWIADTIPVIAGLAIVTGLIGLAVAFYRHTWSEPNE